MSESSWTHAPLKNLIAKLESGVSVNSDDSDGAGGAFGVLKTSCVNGGRFNPQEYKTISPEEVRRAELNPRVDSILISRMNTSSLVGESAYVDRDYAQLFLPDRLWQTVLPSQSPTCVKWLSYVLRSPEFRFHVTNAASGTSGSMKNISQRSYLSISVDVPPIPEQRKIASILTTVDSLIEQTEALIEKYRQVKQGMMADLLSRGVDSDGKLRPTQQQAPELYKQSELGWIPKEWEVAMLGDEIRPIASGWSPVCDGVPAAQDEWAILKTTAVIWAGYVETENKRLPASLIPMKAIEVQVNDILITRKGPVERVGVVVHVPSTRSRLMFPDTVFRVRLNDASDFVPAFVPISLGSEQVQKVWYGRKIGLADAQVNLNHTILKTTALPKPKPDEQRAILERLQVMRDQIFQQQHHLAKLRTLKTGLMQDLLTGKVRVKVDEAEEVTADV